MEENKNELEAVEAENEPVESDATSAGECAEPCEAPEPDVTAEDEPEKKSADAPKAKKPGKLIGIIIAAVALVAAAVVALVIILGGKEPDGGEEHTHVGGEAVKENITAVTCTADGGYDEVVYCTECDEEISRNHITVAATGHSIADTVIAATCLNAGYTEHTCKNEGCTESYVYTYVDALGHNWSAPTCAEDRTCAACDATLPALTHDYVVISSVAATCDTEATATYKCSGCDDEYTEKSGSALGHNINGVTPTAVQVSGCEYVQQYECKTCGEAVDGDTVELHTLKSSITTPATCSQDGVKTIVCTAGCGYSETETIEKNSTGHSWTVGTVVDGKRTDTCENCGETKQVTVYEGTSTGATSSENFKDTEIELNGTGITMDEGVVDAIGNKDVTLSADKLEGDDRLDLELDEETLAQVGDSPIYNFTINDGTENISNFGENNYVTITLPYTLVPGEDVDNIAIWFISDSGELEAIPAVYNNGFVTFKTNHFSYYTVTRLTPAQRCELYGHSDTTKTVAATCLTDGYTLSVCVRCHRTEKSNVVVADGHDFVTDVISASCTASGKVVNTCSDCGYSYESRTPATGHSWELISSTEANCQQSGESVYECSACDASYTDKMPQTPHTLVDTVIAPTCEGEGYTLHECEDCDYSYTDTTVPEIGHAYTVTFVWADGNASAKAQLTCANDAAHNTELDAEVSVKTIDATCSGGTVYEYTATVTVEGTVYTDMQSVSEGEPSHTYGDAWISDDVGHWHECVCGSRDAYAPHDYSSGSVTTEPTCVADGVMTYTCVCGKSVTESIPATGTHNYVDGVCTGCGAENNTCDHKTLHREYIEMSDYGFCPGVVNYLSCDCGEVLVFDENNSDLNCEVEYRDRVEEETENGAYMSAAIVCTDCGMYARVEGWLTESECTEITTYDYSFYRADGVTPIKEHLRVEEKDIDHSTTNVNLATGCGGSISVGKCRNCDKIVEIDGMDLTCQGAPEFDLRIDIYSGEDSEYIYEHACDSCGLYVKYQISVDYEGCSANMYGYIYISMGDDVVADYSETMSDTEHDYEYTRTLMGDSCEDGVREVGTCTACGDVVHSIETYHPGYEYDVELDLSEYSDCYVYVSVDRCTLCGEVTCLNDFDFECDVPGGVQPENILDDNGVIIGMQMTYTCTDCGLTFTQKMFDYNETPCTSVESRQMFIYSGDTCLLNYVETYSHTEHDDEYSYEMLGATCDDGLKVTRICSKCDYSHNYTTRGHDYFEQRTDLSDYGLCGGYYYSYVCIACGDVESTHISDYECHWSGFSYGDGRPSTFTCEVCGTVRVQTRTTSDKDGECQINVSVVTQYYRNDQLVLELSTNETMTEHDYEREYYLYGTSCLDGYRVVNTCKDCGYSYSMEGSYHSNNPVKTYNLTEYGACRGTITLYSCACGEEAWISTSDMCAESWTYNTYVGDDGRVHNVEVRACRDCGLRFETDRYSVRDASICRERVYYTVTITVGNGLVDSFNYEYLNVSHDYESRGELMHGEGSSCEDGVIIHRVCRDCGDSMSDEYDYHITYQANRYSASSIGSACGGEIIEYTCACGYDHYLSFENMYCELEHQYTDIWVNNAITGWIGDVYYNYDAYDIVCSVTDPDCDFVVRYACYYLEEGCVAVQYKTYLIGYDESTGTYELEITFKTGNIEQHHNYTQREIEGVEGGLNYRGNERVCSDCGAFRTYKQYFDAQDNLVKNVTEYSDELAFAGYSYSIVINEYTPVDDKQTHITREYRRYVYSDGTESIREYKYTYYMGYQYMLERYIADRAYWERTVYDYNFSTCSVVVTYTDSEGRDNVYNESAHQCYWEIIKNPTCTQNGIEAEKCRICNSLLNEYSTNPGAHEWEYFEQKGIYVCMSCGLENANGASGEIVMEDLTSNDGDNYVVGYWCKDEYLEFTYYVEILVGDEPIILSGVDVRLSKDPRAYVFSKAEVADLASRYGYSAGEYQVRFVAVPYGSDGSYDYAITFSAPPEEELDYIDGNATVKYNLDRGEIMEITLYASESGTWEIYSYSSSDTRAEILKDGRYVTEDDDSGVRNSFYMLLEAAEDATYTVYIMMFDKASSDDVTVVFNKIN